MRSVLFLCRANVCRSPMAAALVSDRLRQWGVPVSISSAATAAPGTRPDAATIKVMAARGIDVSAHRGRQVSASDLLAADLVVAMARENLRHAVVLEPRAWPRTFTFKELVRRAQEHGPRQRTEPAARWLARIAQDRTHSQLLGSDDADDVADPVGGTLAAYELTAGLLTELADDLIAFCWGITGPSRRASGRAVDRADRHRA